MNTLKQLESKWQLVERGANVFGGGRSNLDNDLNWAMQQIRPFGKPAGDVEKYNKKAADILRKFIPSLEPHAAGELVREIHELTHRYSLELAEKFEARGLKKADAIYQARGMAYELQVK